MYVPVDIAYDGTDSQPRIHHNGCARSRAQLRYGDMLYIVLGIFGYKITVAIHSLRKYSSMYTT